MAFLPSVLRAQESAEVIYAFRNYTRPEPIRMILVGQIQSKTKAAEVHEQDSPFRGYDTRMDQVLVKVVNRTGLKVGQKLYVIDKNPFHQEHRNGLIVGEITVTAILYNPFYGWVITGQGILLRVRIGQFIARTLESENLDRARVLKRNGDHHYNAGNFERAIASYNSAIEADSDLPEAHAALGRVYLDLARQRQNQTPIRSLAEFERAWTNKENFQYTHDQLEFYKDYMDALYFAYSIRRLEQSRENQITGYLDRILEVAAASQAVQADQIPTLIHIARVQYHRMQLHRSQSGVEERRLYDDARTKAGEILTKLVQGQPREAEAYRLGVLYYAEIYPSIVPGTVDNDRQRTRIRNTVEYCARQYDLYLDESKERRDPRIDSALRSVRR